MKGLYVPPGKLVWMFRYTRHGRQHRVSLRTRDEAEAIAKAGAILDAPELSESGDYEGEIAAYLHAQRKADRLSRHSVGTRAIILPLFFKHVGKPMIAEVTTGDVQRWYGSLKVGEDSRQTYVRWLRAFYRWQIERGRLRVNPCEGVKTGRLRPIARKGTLSREDVLRLLDCENEQLRFVLFCGFHAGMRKEEVIEARPEWFDLKGGHIHIGPTDTWIPKDREKRSVPISKAFAAFLKTYGLRSPYMLAPAVKRGKSKYRYDFGRPFRAHLAACGIKCTFHDARRTFASHLVSAGMSVYKVAKYLGDGVGVVERHYGHLQPDAGEFDRMMG